MPHAPIYDNLDPADEPARTVEEHCAVEFCPESPRPVGTKMKNRPLCRDHHAAAMRDWRARRRAAELPVAGASASAPSSSPAAVRRRVALSRAIAAGKAERRPCSDCGTKKDVLAAHLDPAKPELVMWRCRIHRYDEVVERERKRAEAAAESARRAAIRALPERRRTALELLDAAPPEVVAAIRTEASSFMGRTLTTEMPLYRQRLAQIAEARLRRP